MFSAEISKSALLSFETPWLFLAPGSPRLRLNWWAVGNGELALAGFERIDCALGSAKRLYLALTYQVCAHPSRTCCIFGGKSQFEVKQSFSKKYSFI